VDCGQAVGQHRLHQLVLGGGKLLLGLQRIDQVGRSLAVLELRNLDRLVRRRDLGAQMAFRPSRVGKGILFCCLNRDGRCFGLAPGRELTAHGFDERLVSCLGLRAPGRQFGLRWR